MTLEQRKALEELGRREEIRMAISTMMRDLALEIASVAMSKDEMNSAGVTVHDLNCKVKPGARTLLIRWRQAYKMSARDAALSRAEEK